MSPEDHIDITLKDIYKEVKNNSKILGEISGLRDHIKYIWAVIIVMLAAMLANIKGVI